MCHRFNINNPKIIVAGLNPHAGEGGILGNEEKKIITPALESARSQGINCSGPFPADTLFYRMLKKEFDLILSIYHDQGLVAVKTLTPYNGTNITLGLPFIRTSPMHGTAFDISGKGIADESSLEYAIKTVLFMNRQKN